MPHMGIISQNEVNIQETISTVLHIVPTVITCDKGAYILVRDVSKDLEEYLQTGKKKTAVINAIDEKLEQELTTKWRADGYKYSFRHQILEYMHKRISVRYPEVTNPNTHTSVSLLPWCMLPGRPYPVFVYAFATWHYTKSEHKSMMQSANAAGKVFGVESFNKSTLSRLRKDNNLSCILMDVPPADSRKAGNHCIDEAAYVTELLELQPPAKNICKLDSSKQDPPATGNTEFTINELNTVPLELSKVIKDSQPICQKNRDTRKRPPRPRHMNKTKRVQRLIRYADSSRIEHIRKTFIMFCKVAVMDAAVKYQRFLV
jgi:hypothetical protein